MSLSKAWSLESMDGDSSLQQAIGDLLETLLDAAIVIGEDTRILASNQAAYESFGRGNGALEGKRLSEVIRDFTLHDAFRKALSSGNSSEIELELIGNETRKYTVRISPITVSGLTAAIGYFHDFTRIERLERIRQEFLSNVSHELRTPLTSILAFVETLEDGAIDDVENNGRFLTVIRRNAERMQRLIDDIQELTSIESGRTRLEPRDCDLRSLVEDVFLSFESKLSKKDVKGINEVPKGLSVFADPVRLEQMLVNLIGNGIKFNRDGGSVTVSARQTAEAVFISIADTGEGISGEHLTRIFERFYRTDRARSRDIGGTGLGLAICKHLARLHGGEVSVTSSFGKGSTFTIELPKQN
jgi:two-component system, OmpR family, phosphate regulon sensor histidine kinase PhoR